MRAARRLHAWRGMTRLLALVSYVYQSAAAIILIFAISHVLAPADYTGFSLVLASSQLLCVLTFEWLQLAGLRFLAAATGADAARLRVSLLAAGLISTLALVAIGALAAAATRLPPHEIALGLALAVLQGLTDLLFTMIRLSDRLATAALLLVARASVLLIGAVAGALIGGSSASALSGSVAGYLLSLVAAVFWFRAPLQRIAADAIKRDLIDFCRYGMLAAGASVIHLTVPVTIRYIVIARLSADPAVSAGFSMAIDLLQRPFAVLVAAIHTVNYPEVVFQFEHGSARDARMATARLFDFILCTTVVMLGGLIGFLPDAGRLFVPSAILAPFLVTAPAAALFYFLHTQLQGTLAVIPHLRKSALRLVVVAGSQLASVAAVSAAAVGAGFSPAEVLDGAAAATFAVGLLASGPTLGFRATPRTALLATAASAALLIASLSIIKSDPLPWLLAKIAVAAAATAVVARQGDFLSMTQSVKGRVSG